MKRGFFLLAFLSLTLASIAQDVLLSYYRCEIDHTPVRVGPGDEFEQVQDISQPTPEENVEDRPFFMLKGAIVGSDNIMANGYILVHDLSYHQVFGKGWVEMKKLKRLDEICKVCKGSGHTDEICPVCKGEDDSSCGYCGGTGFENCPKCEGIGYK